MNFINNLLKKKNKANILEYLTSKFYLRTEEIANLQKIIKILFKEQYL